MSGQPDGDVALHNAETQWQPVQEYPDTPAKLRGYLAGFMERRAAVLKEIGRVHHNEPAAFVTTTMLACRMFARMDKHMYEIEQLKSRNPMSAADLRLIREHQFEWIACCPWELGLDALSMNPDMLSSSSA